MSAWFDAVSSLKAKLGLLVVASVVTAVLLTLLGSAAAVSPLLVLPVSVALALGVTQLLAAGMVAPLRRMTEVSRAMARGDYSGRVRTSATDEVGQLATAFNRMAEDLARVDRERRDLIATVSHELRTPLTAMTALLENLADGVVPADSQHLGAALEEAQRLGRLVEDLLQLSRLEAGVVDLDRQDVALPALVEDVVAQVRATGRTLDVAMDVADDLVVAGDPARLRQLLVNVVDNAARHAPAETSVRITAGADGADTDGSWWLEVVDAGGGVAPEDRERVFERFGTDGAGGTGLGLAVARWVAQLHGGSLRFLDPEVEQGARIRLEVPGERAGAVLTSPTPVPSAVPSAVPPAAASAVPPAVPPTVAASETTPRPQSGLDAVFGRFWPDRAAPHGLRTVVAAAGAGLVAGVALSFTAVGISWTLVALTCGAAALATARRRREPWTLVCAGLAVLLVLPMTLRAAWWVQMLGLVVAAAVFLCGVTGARTLPGILLSGMAWPLASLRGLPWFGRSLRIAGTGSRTPAVVRTTVWSLLGLGVFGTIFASANPVFGSWVDQLVPNLTFNDLVGRAFLACFVFAATLGAAYLALNPADVEVLGGRRPTAARQPLRVARPGARGRRGVPRLHRRAGAGAGRRTRLHRGHDRADLRRLRPPGLRPAHPGHGADGAGRVDRLAARRRRRRGPPLAAGLARPALRPHAAGRRVRPPRHVGLPGRVRLHDAAALRRRLRGVARLRRARDHGRRRRSGAVPGSRASRSCPGRSRSSGWPRSTPTPGSPDAISTATRPPASSTCATSRTSRPTRRR